jgi:hypothetical protein
MEEIIDAWAFSLFALHQRCDQPSTEECTSTTKKISSDVIQITILKTPPMLERALSSASQMHIHRTTLKKQGRNG